MAVVSDQSRVAYVVSSDLIHFSDLLPSNPGRSSLVHSLAYHLDLLDLSLLQKDGITDEHDKLLKAFHGEIQDDHATSSSRRKAIVYQPRAATRAQMTAYHEADFIDQLCSDIAADEPRKRLKRSHANDKGRSHSPSPDKTDLPHSVKEGSMKGHTGANNQFGLQDDCPAFQGLGEHVALVAGASITAAELVATGEADIAIAWDGGRHHAKKHSASGFCYVNDAVLAILALRKPRKVNISVNLPGNNGEVTTVGKTTVKRFDRVMYIDLDLHWGDGVEEAFYTSPNVLTLSIHHFAPGFFPCYAASTDPEKYGPPGSLTSEGGSGSKSLNIPLGLGTSDVTLERIMQTAVQPIYEAWDPEVIVVQCGVDGLAEDPMSVWNLSTSAYVRAIQSVLAWRKPTVLLGGGGYKSENAARCWSMLTAACLERIHDEPSRRSPPTTSQTLLPLTSQGSQKDQAKEHAVANASEANLDRISGKTLIPDHKYWPQYEPEYTLEVRAGEQIDQNDETHFQNIQKQIHHHVDVILAGRKSTKQR